MQQLKINLFEAYYEARRNKRNTYNQLKFEICYEQELFKLYEEIANRTYNVGKSIAFIVNKPVMREIFAASFRDRVVHHLVFNYINPIIEPQFINDSYSCRKGKGTLYGIQRANNFMKSITNNYKQDAYILKLDIQGYFMSIYKPLLIEKLRQIVSKEAFDRLILIRTKGNEKVDIDYDTLFYLISEILVNNPVDDCIIKGSISDWKTLPASKSLFKAAPDCGLPIGNLTSQLFSNVYLNDFDHYIRNTLGYPHYGRYVDDFFIMSKSSRDLRATLILIRQYLQDNFLLKIHPKKIVFQHYTKGMNFLGAYIMPYRIYIAHRTKTNFAKKLHYLSTHLKDKTGLSFQSIVYLRSLINSYLGLLMHYKTYRLRYKLILNPSACSLFRLGFFDGKLSKFFIYQNLQIHNQLYLLK